MRGVSAIMRLRCAHKMNLPHGPWLYGRIVHQARGALYAAGEHALPEGGGLSRSVCGIHKAQMPILPYGVGPGRAHGRQQRRGHALDLRIRRAGQKGFAQESLGLRPGHGGA